MWNLTCFFTLHCVSRLLPNTVLRIIRKCLIVIFRNRMRVLIISE